MNNPSLEWDEFKREANIAKHGLDFDDAHIVLKDQNQLTISSPFADEIRFLMIGKLGSRMVAVVYTLRDDRIRVISMRSAHKAERQAYDRHKRD